MFRVYALAVSTFLFCNFSACYGTADMEATELTPLVIMGDGINNNNNKPLEAPVKARPVPALSMKLSPQKRVFYNHDLLVYLASFLDKTDRENLACLSVHTFRILEYIFNPDAGGLRRLQGATLYGKAIRSSQFRSDMLGTHAYLNQDPKGSAVKTGQFIRELKNLLYEAYIRHPYSREIKGGDRDLLKTIAYLRNVPVPAATRWQSIWALYDGYRNNHFVTIPRVLASWALLVGGGLYIVVESANIPGWILGSSCLTNIITNATIDYASDYDGGFGRKRGVDKPHLLMATPSFLVIISTLGMSAAGVASSLLYPYDAFECRKFIDASNDSSLRPDTTLHPLCQDMLDFLARIETSNHYVPASHLLLYKASKFNDYIQSLVNAPRDVEAGQPQLDPKIVQIVRKLSAIMSCYKASIIYRLFGGEAIKNKLLEVTRLPDIDTMSRREKLKIAFYGDYFMRYVPSAAFWWGMYQFSVTHYVGQLKELRLLGEPSETLSYDIYMKNYTGSASCCLTDTRITNSLCPPLDSSYKNYFYQLANSTIYQPREWEYVLMNVPLLFLFYHLFHWLIG